MMTVVDPVPKDRKLVIVGDSAFAEVAYEYFVRSSRYEPVAFAVERAFLKRDALFGIPVVPLESLSERFPPTTHDVYVAIVYTELNRLRTRLVRMVKAAGYALASYVSPYAFVWPNVRIGEHCFIFENNVVQPFVTLGDNVVLWSGNHIGHHSVIRDNCFIASHVVISGFVDIGANCFLGVNATVANNLSIGADCLVGAGAVVAKNVEPDHVVKGRVSETALSARRYFKVRD